MSWTWQTSDRQLRNEPKAHRVSFSHHRSISSYTKENHDQKADYEVPYAWTNVPTYHSKDNCFCWINDPSDPMLIEATTPVLLKDSLVLAWHSRRRVLTLVVRPSGKVSDLAGNDENRLLLCTRREKEVVRSRHLEKLRDQVWVKWANSGGNIFWKCINEVYFYRKEKRDRALRVQMK